MIDPVWENIPGVGSFVQRTRTPTGWLVREVLEVAHVGPDLNEYVTTGYDWRVAMVFVPDPDGLWLAAPKAEEPEPVNKLAGETIYQLRECWDRFISHSSTAYVRENGTVITIEEVRDELCRRGDAGYCNGH